MILHTLPLKHPQPDAKKFIDTGDRSILRRLAERVAEIAALAVHQQTADLWWRLNDLEPVRPMVWINEIPWHEMDINGELTLQTTDLFCRQVEEELRRTIYLWDHMRVDMVVEPVFYSPLAIHDTGFGIDQDIDFIQQDPHSNIISRRFHPQIQDEKDLEKIRMPQITHDEAASERTYQTLVDLFGEILPIEKCGVVHKWFAPWDELIRWWGIQEALMDLILRPELVHQAMDRLVNAYLARLDQWEESNLLSWTPGNYRVGSGGLGYTDELPGAEFDPAYVRSYNQWGCAAAQIFSEVSPQMHQEFALDYEKRWLERFGLTYYGCCDPLHHKVDILKTIPNLRKISMSPWADVEQGVEALGDRYVFSHKPNPAIFATDDWNPAQARRNLERVLEKTPGCAVEVIMKDISTVRYKPHRLWEWSEIAMDVVEAYS